MFDKKSDSGSSSSATGPYGPKFSRHSGAWAALRKRLNGEAGLRVVDAGTTSPHNINYLTNMGHSIYLADPVADALTGEWEVGKDEDDKTIWNVDGYLEHAVNFSGRLFDIVLLWTTLDYIPEPLVAPVVDRLFASMNPGGQVLAFFHARMKPDESSYCRFLVTETDSVEMQLAQPFQLQRVFTNRSIQELFSRWSGFRQFLAKDGVYEVLITR